MAERISRALLPDNTSVADDGMAILAECELTIW
ncbi:MAG: hypothetical protein Ct9H90mP5_04990 [Acidimicrobiaceae bacterium]|nr:MAG: hypothetical protein Ct9H90mP5_04990 [Acidimicrobiaceae bacterium]